MPRHNVHKELLVLKALLELAVHVETSTTSQDEEGLKKTNTFVDRALFHYFCNTMLMEHDPHYSWKLALRCGDVEFATTQLMEIAGLERHQSEYVIRLAQTSWIGTPEQQQAAFENIQTKIRKNSRYGKLGGTPAFSIEQYADVPSHPEG